MFTTLPDAPLKPAKKVRYGLLKVVIESNHVVRSPDGTRRQYQVIDISRQPKANKVAVCLQCKQTWATEEELLAAHPEQRVMEKNQETHCYAWWSDDPVEKCGSEDPKDIKKHNEDAKRKGAVLGLMSDVPFT